MSKQLTLKELNKNLEEFKKYVLDRFEKIFKVNVEEELDEPAPCLSCYTEVGTEIDIGELGSIRLLDSNYNGTGKKIWQCVKDFNNNESVLGLPNNSNADGYPSAKTIHIFLEVLFNKLPNWLKEQIVEVDVPCFIPSANVIKDVKSKLFLLSATEMCQNRPHLAREGKPLEYYIKNVSSFDNWNWLRTPDITSKNVWGCVSYSGIVSITDTIDYNGVAPAFCTD